MPNGGSAPIEKHGGDVAAAIQAVKDHPESKFSHIAHAHNIHRGTLYNRLHERTHDRRHAHAGQQLLATEEGKEVVSKILEWDERGAAPKHRCVDKMAASVIQARATPAEATSSHHWVTRFIKRHGDISTKVAHPMDRDRILAMDQRAITHHFNTLQDVISRNKIHPEDIWNPDETG